ncbi:AP2-like ethylene-responsive transcription factor At1g16060 isoform X2 [Nymphaea colorata]|uniref:AP2-like ethylene-responsive transcription factor At1g16060 isoform X2 n=1 Tax=Nymphaea colorata TaxID=210225 RepID=UPI00214E5E55|nr:AP2-like ethylene-responsive transcription factor At1g16060 isoform X2 [Nymphaea colorata]
MKILTGGAVYLGAYDDEEAAARAYDLAALKYWGNGTQLNFPISTYSDELKEMEGLSREEYIGSLRRKSSGFSRGVSKYRGVARHHHNGRWEARIGRVLGNKYLYLGTYATQEEAATAYDMAAIEYRGVNAVTNFDLSRYMKWIKPSDAASGCTSSNTTADENSSAINSNLISISSTNSSPETESSMQLPPTELPSSTIEDSISGFQQQQPYHNHHLPQPQTNTDAASTIGLLLQSSTLKEMIQRSSADLRETPPESDELGAYNFLEDIHTYFEYQDYCSYSNGFGDVDRIFGDLSSVEYPDEYSPFAESLFSFEHGIYP